MVATIDIQVTASNPTIPLFPWRVFRKSLSSLRIRNVPKRIGNWSITGVSISATYPDNQITTKDCTLVGGVWICTMPSCDVSGNVSRGYAVIAKGKDESGKDVESYILGRGDIYVIDADIKTNALPKTYSVTLCPNKPDNPTDGDIWLDNGVWYICKDGDTYTLGISKDDVETMLEGYVPATRKVNGKSLDDDVNLTASDVGALGDVGSQTIKTSLSGRSTLILKGDDLYGGGALIIEGNKGTGQDAASLTISDKDSNQGGNLTIYGGQLSKGATIDLIDNDNAPFAKSEITIGDVKVRQSITDIKTTLAPVTSTLADYIRQVVTSTYTNANTKGY